MQIQELSLRSIRPSPANPRIFHGADGKNQDLASLAASIREKGVLSPVLVRPTLRIPVGAGGLPTDPGYELIAGERRFRAAKLAGLETIPAIVRTDLSDQEALELTVTENLQREDLHPLEEANGVAALLGSGADLAAVADRLGKPMGWVARRARLAKLSPKWRKLAEDPKSPVSAWPATMLELVATLEPEAQDAFWQEHQWLGSDNRNCSIGELRRHLADWTMELRLAPWKADDATLDPQAGACSACPKRSSCNPGLFDDDLPAKKAKAGDRCLDATCWNRKLDRHLARKADEVRREHGKVVFCGHLHYGEKAPAFTKGEELVDAWDGRPAKKGDRGAVPVLHVVGRERGKLEWKVFGREASAKAKKAAGGAAAKVVTPLAERRKALEGRRRAHALEATCEAVETAATPSASTLILLAAAFGTEHKADRPGNDWHERSKAAPALLDKPDRAHGELWKSVAEVIVRRWQYALRTFGVSGLAKHSKEIGQVAELLSIDLTPFAAAAAEAIPEPKSWAKLAEAEKAARKAKPAAASTKAKKPSKGTATKGGAK